MEHIGENGQRPEGQRPNGESPDTVFAFSVIEEKPHRQKAIVKIAREHIHALYNEALLSQKSQASTFGFDKGTTPLHYIEQNFRANIVQHLKELLFNHCVVDILYESLCTNKIVVVGDPDLIDIQLEPEQDAEFTFLLNNIQLDNDQRWKRAALRKIERKNYKDLDRQVEAFIQEETHQREQATSLEITFGDWINFEITIMSKDKNALMKNYKSELWIRIAPDEDDKDLHELFLGKKVGDSFLTQSIFLQEYLSLAFDMDYIFFVEIKDRLPHAYFEIDLFKHLFELKDDNELRAKLVEVFSTRNDISLRREMIEAVFKVLSKQYFFMLPQALLERQRQMVLAAVQHNPDYQVYKSQADFKERVRQLAEKQLKEAIIIDALAYQECITVSREDVRAYLNLLKRPRMKEFMYFTIPQYKIQGQELPLSVELIKRYCLREKTLNHIIKVLTNK